MCRPAAACHCKGCQVTTSAQGRVHGRQVLGLYGVQWLEVVWHANLCHFQTLINRELLTPAGEM